jgi:hypothetical protein
LQFIDRHRDHWPITVMCRVLDVSASAFYQFAGRPRSATEAKLVGITEAIKTVHNDKHHDAYGSPMMHRDLINRGIECCRGTVAKCIKNTGIAANRRDKFRISTTDSNHDHPIAPNLLEQNFETKAINEVWLTDITSIPTRKGFTYLATIVDLHSRKIIAWKTSSKIDSTLVLAVLHQAITLRGPAVGVIVHRTGWWVAPTVDKRKHDQYKTQPCKKHHSVDITALALRRIHQAAATTSSKTKLK